MASTQPVNYKPCDRCANAGKSSTCEKDISGHGCFRCAIWGKACTLIPVDGQGTSPRHGTDPLQNSYYGQWPYAPEPQPYAQPPAYAQPDTSAFAGVHQGYSADDPAFNTYGSTYSNDAENFPSYNAEYGGSSLYAEAQAPTPLARHQHPAPPPQHTMDAVVADYSYPNSAEPLRRFPCQRCTKFTFEPPHLSLTTTSMDVPHFPRELERQILEIAAETRLQEVPNLLLIAHRAYVWLEPFLYRAIHLSHWENPGRERDAQEAFLRAASSKSPTFLAKAVRRVSIDLSDEYNQLEMGLELIEALQACTGITGFAMNGSLNSAIGAKFFSVFDLVQLHRLAAFLGELMPSSSPMDGQKPIFRSLTHLEVFDRNIETDPRYLPFLVALPALTHLALHPEGTGISNTLVGRNGCPHLQILVLFPRELDEDRPFAEMELRANTVGRAVPDPRVVVTVSDSFSDCIAVQKHTYWDEAEIFVKKKRLGQIPKDHYWTADFYAAMFWHAGPTLH
ncbi:hypothetical protein C8F01DRAFT_1295672 [Mycena amicta]|nr:hypothetical protein C8F01DRAFT_1295672 [Mycena amicta]